MTTPTSVRSANGAKFNLQNLPKITAERSPLHQGSGFAVSNDSLISHKQSCHRGLLKGLHETQSQKAPN